MIFVCLLVDLILGFVSYLTLENGGLNLPSTIILVLQAARTLLCPVDFMGISFETVFSTVVLDTISFQTDVSSITIMLASWKLNCFWIRRTCITYAAIRSFKYDGSFWAVVVFCLREKPCLCINFSHHPLLTTNEVLMTGWSFFSLKMLLAFHIITFLLTGSILLRFS